MIIVACRRSQVVHSTRTSWCHRPNLLPAKSAGEAGQCAVAADALGRRLVHDELVDCLPCTYILKATLPREAVPGVSIARSTRHAGRGLRLMFLTSQRCPARRRTRRSRRSIAPQLLCHTPFGGTLIRHRRLQGAPPHGKHPLALPPAQQPHNTLGLSSLKCDACATRVPNFRR